MIHCANKYTRCFQEAFQEPGHGLWCYSQVIVHPGFIINVCARKNLRQSRGSRANISRCGQSTLSKKLGTTLFPPK